MATQPVPEGWRRMSIDVDCGYNFRTVSVLVRVRLTSTEVLELRDAIRHADEERQNANDPRWPKAKRLRYLVNSHTQFVNIADRDLDAETTRTRLALLLRSNQTNAA